VLTLTDEVLPATFRSLRACGDGRRECVVYWTGPVDQPQAVDGVVQPGHDAGWGWYEVDTHWLAEFFLELRRQRRTIRAQVHTHPGRRTAHSDTDDGFAAAPSTGMVSIVLPGFATGPVGLDGATIYELDARGDWIEQAHGFVG
jgi:hypothetical protein